MPTFKDFYFNSSTGKNKIHARMCVPDAEPRAIVQIIQPVPCLIFKRLAIIANTFTTSPRAMIQLPRKIPENKPQTASPGEPNGSLP